MQLLRERPTTQNDSARASSATAHREIRRAEPPGLLKASASTSLRPPPHPTIELSIAPVCQLGCLRHGGAHCLSRRAPPRARVGAGELAVAVIRGDAVFQHHMSRLLTVMPAAPVERTRRSSTLPTVPSPRLPCLCAARQRCCSAAAVPGLPLRKRPSPNHADKAPCSPLPCTFQASMPGFDVGEPNSRGLTPTIGRPVVHRTARPTNPGVPTALPRPREDRRSVDWRRLLVVKRRRSAD